jgi:TonB family protein
LLFISAAAIDTVVADIWSRLPSDINASRGGHTGGRPIIDGVEFTLAPLPAYPRPHTAATLPEGQGSFSLQLDRSTGTVRAVRTIKTTGYDAFDHAAAQALRHWRAKPGLQRTEVIVQIAFWSGQARVLQ